MTKQTFERWEVEAIIRRAWLEAEEMAVAGEKLGASDKLVQYWSARADGLCEAMELFSKESKKELETC